VPELALVLSDAAPADATRGAVAGTPENSWTVIAIAVGDAKVTVTVCVGLALAAYHISPSE
jgi:hypothetical protein